MKTLYFLSLLTLLTSIIYVGAADDKKTNPCGVYASCGSCLTENYKCRWCEDQDFAAGDLMRPRCDLERNLINAGCKRIQRNDRSGKESCDCEKRGVRNSPLCSGMGTFKCGVCSCNEGRFGEKCECDHVKMMDISTCRSSDSAMICSGFGTCICGKCLCDKRANPLEVISGKYCECNNFACDRYQGMICGGPERGVCECGKCVCKEAYRGDNCGGKNCDLLKSSCMLHDKVCSGNGVCNCGSCKCNTGYKGRYCESNIFGSSG